MATAVPETITTVPNDDVSNNQLELMCNLEEIALIWYDADMNASMREKLKITKKHLRSINNFVILHQDEQTCIDTIKSIKNEKIILVTSGSGADSILSSDEKIVHKSVQAIFIFCHATEKYQSLLRKYSKIIGIFSDLEELKASIKKEVELIQKHFETFNFYNRNEQKSICSLSKESATFLWLLISKDIIVRMEKDEKAKSQMIDTCTKYYHGNRNELKLIKEFDKTYKEKGAIYWYTRPSFVYKLVNKALRTQDVEQLYTFRFFISDLCEEIAKQHKQMSNEQSLMVYRGVRLPIGEVEKLKDSEGKLISTNGFLSTSCLREVAIDFALTMTETNTEESVLFEIECDRNSITFANIEKESVCLKEAEVLFDLGATFEVLSVTESREKTAKIIIWIVKVRSTQEGMKLAHIYIEQHQSLLQKKWGAEILWGYVLAEIGQPNKATKYLQKLLDTYASDIPPERIYLEMSSYLVAQGKLDEALRYAELYKKDMEKKIFVAPGAHSLLGTIYQKKGQYDRALEEYNNDLLLFLALQEYGNNSELPLAFAGANRGCIVIVYRRIGEIYLDMGQYQLAIDYLNKSREIGEKCFSDNHISYALTLTFIGDVHKEKDELDRAMECYKEAADMFENYLPQGDAGAFLRMSSVLYLLDDYDKSLEYAYRALEIEPKGCVDMEYDKACNYIVIGRIHFSKREFEKAFVFFEKALNQRLQSLDKNHPDVAISYHLIGNALACLDRNDKALVALEAGLAIQKQVFPNGHRHTADSLISIGYQYQQRGMFLLARNYYNEALEIQKKVLPPDHLDSSLTLYHIALTLYDQQDYHQSLNYLYKALKIQKKATIGIEPFSQQAFTLSAIGDVNKRLGNVGFALQCFKDALSIKEKYFSQQEHLGISELRSKIRELEQTEAL